MLPSSVVGRKKKGFGIPLVKWLRQVPEVLPLAPLPGIRMDYVRHAFKENRSGHADHRLLIWNWIVMQTYARREELGHLKTDQARASM